MTPAPNSLRRLASQATDIGFRLWVSWWIPLFMGKRLSCALILDRLKSGSFKIQSYNKATVDVHGWSMVCTISHLHPRIIWGLGITVCIFDKDRRGFLCVARSWLDGQMPEPLIVERVTGSDFHAFFTYTFNPDHSVDIINVTDGYGSTYNFKYVYYKK